MIHHLTVPAVAFLSLAIARHTIAEAPLRAGIVGCDTSHVIAFTKLINDPAAKGPLTQVEVTCAYPGGSPDLPASRDRVDGYVEQLRDAGVTILPSIAEVLANSDVLLLESVDGRVHLEQFRQLAAGKPVFIDKPAAASLADLVEIFRIAASTGTPCFTSSALRFSDAVVALKNSQQLGELTGCTVASPLQIEPHHPDLFWYGVHGVESLFTLMGRGCQRVSRTDGPHASVVVGAWDDGRIATYQGLKGHADYAFTAYGTKGLASQQGFAGYEPLVGEVCQFFVSRQPPVPPEETLEMFAFMEAADESLRRGGEPVALQEMFERAASQSSPPAPAAPATTP